MEILIEFLVDLILSGSIELSKSNKLPKKLRILLIILISLFFISMIGLIILTGILIIKNNIYAGLILITIGLFLLILSIIKFIRIYIRKVG